MAIRSSTARFRCRGCRWSTTGSGRVSCPSRSLPPGSVMDCTAQYTTTAADVAAASTIVNRATATWVTPSGSQSRSDTADVNYRSPLT
ncbi:DUF7507 domain-containing protein [Parafrankia sp. FMc2]|uniref:DUF7507 domain-containing protein n=1 Tax=Parafrankia sp. FMc2 TaxID=3233196 RepID=UPI003B585D82